MVKESEIYEHLTNDTTSIEILNLSTRYYNALRRSGIVSIKDLIFLLKRKHLLSVRNLGDIGKQEIIKKLNNYANGASKDTIHQDDIFREEDGLKLDEQKTKPQSKYHILLDDNTPIIALNLPIRPYNALQRHWIISIGDLVSMVEKDLFSVKNMGAVGVNSVLKNLDVYLHDVEENGYSFLEKTVDGPVPLDDVNQSLALMKIKERYWKVLHARSFGKTLAEVAKEIGVTRERVRQIEVFSLQKLFGQIDLLHLYFDFLELHADDLKVSLERETSFDVVAKQTEKISLLYDGEKITSDTIQKTLMLLRFLPKSQKEIEKERWSKIIFKACSIFPYITEHDEVVEKIEHLKEQNRRHTYEELAYEVLHKEREPRHWKFIVERAEALKKRGNFNVAGLYNVLQDKNEVFVRVDAGTYALVEWGLSESEYYTDIVAKILKKERKALSFGTIYQQVKIVREVDKSSLTMLLDLNPRFYKSKASTFGLRAWLPPRHKQTLLTPQSLIEDQKSLLRVENAIKHGYNVEEIIERDK